MNAEERVKLEILSAYIGKPLTEEQMEFASDFRQNTISFSDPGTGKTHTLVAGLIMAQDCHKIPGKLINCMSFTNAAVYEMKGRYDKLCKRVNVAPTVVFNTFHSMANAIMRQAYPTIKIAQKSTLVEDIKAFKEYMRELDIPCNDYDYAKRVYNALNSLNSALVFHPEHLQKKFDFVNLDIDLEKFQALRVKWFVRGIINNLIQKGDIPLYCLYALMSKPDIGKVWRGKFKIMVVDEFQDLSLLHLHILSMVAETLIVIGDMKQQIYHFNGACQQIVDEYLKVRPDARICNLTHSFRCAQEISEFATKVYLPNDRSIVPFTGVKEGGSISIVERRNLNWEEIAKTIHADVKSHTFAKARDVMFLYRNNASAIPIIEQLYKLGVPFRCSRFQTIMDTPIFSDLCKLVNAAWQPEDIRMVEPALRMFPEFKKLTFGSPIPPIDIMKSTGKSIFEIMYKYEQESSKEILVAMQVARNKIMENKSAGIVLNNVLQVYDQYILKGAWWTFDNDKEFYFNLVAPICNKKTYPQMYAEENEKATFNERNCTAGVGIRCYTMHSAKGLEADDIYILDCDEGIFPNAKILKRKLQAGCRYDAACDLRSERNLLYVAITRAKENVIISFSNDKPAELIVHPESNEYLELDDVYENENMEFDNADEFCKLFKLGKYKIVRSEQSE